MRIPVPEVIPIPASSFITIRCPTHETSINALMGSDVPRITGGYGGWKVVDHPRKRSSIEYEGMDPLEIQFEIILDAWMWDARITNVDTMLADLEEMTRPTAKNMPPPLVYLDGKAIPRSESTPWVITGITWGTTIRNTEGETKRQTVQLTMIQADAKEHSRLVPKPAQARNPRAPAGQRARTYLWKKGDTWAQVALKLMGDKKHAITIIDFNKFRPGHKMKPGVKIKVPRAPSK